MSPHPAVYIVVLSCVLVGACDASPPAEAPRAEPPAARHPSPDRAIEECETELRRVTETLPGERAATVARACAGLFVEAGCRDAMRTYGSVPPERRAATVLRACREAYCPVLDAPKPAVCSRDLATVTVAEMGQLYADLRDAALERDLGPNAARAKRTLSQAPVSPGAVLPIPGNLPGVTTIRLKVAPDGDGKVRLEVVAADGRTTSRTGIAAREGAIATAVRELAPAGTDAAAVIEVDASMAYGTLVTVLDGVRTAGYPNASLASAE